MSDLTLAVIDGEPRIDSRLVAVELGVETKAVHQLVDKYSMSFQELGSLPFEMEVRKREIGATQERFCLLNEDHTYFLMTLVRNTEQAVEFKKRLVKAFAECRALMRAQPVAFREEELTLLRAQLAACHAELLKLEPLWGKVARYKKLGLNHTEIGLLTGRGRRPVGRQVRRIEACGLLPPRDSMQLALLEG